MTLREEVNPIPYKKRQYVHHMLTEQGEDPAEFEELVADRTVQPQSIYDMLRRRNISVSHGTVHKWCRDARDSA